MAKTARAGKIIARPRKAPAKVRARRPMVIDMHSHIVVPEIGPILKRLPAHDGPGRRQWISGSSAGERNRMVNANLPRQMDLKVRFKEMDQMGIDIQVISYNIPTKGYYADGATGLKIARICNDTIAEFVSRAPDRFVGMGSVPLQDVRRATKELERAVTGLGLRGAWISSHVRAKDLGEKRLWPFWAKAQELDVPIFIHPQGFTHPERLQNAMLWSTIGQPLEEALAMASFIYDGVLDAYPKLKIGVCHGGGFLPYYIGRHNNSYRARAEIKNTIRQSPEAYLKRFYCDTVIFDPDMLPFLVKKVGAGRVVLGSDYPWNSPDPVSFVRKAKGISKQTKEQILSKNAARLFNIRL